MASGKRSIEIEPVGRRQATSSQSVFQGEDGLRLLCYPVKQLQVANSSPKTRQHTGYIDAKMSTSDRDSYSHAMESENRQILCSDAIVTREPVERPIWRRKGGLAEADDCDDDDGDEDDLEDERLYVDEGYSKINKSSGDMFNPGQIDERELNQHATLGVSSNANHLQRKDYQFQNVLPLSAISGGGHYVRVVNVSEAPATQGTEMLVMEKGSVTVSTQWKEAPLYESVRSLLSDPFTGELMDDAVIFPCGHSFGAGGCQHSLQKKACYTCSRSITEDSVQRNLTLRAAVAAFRREKFDNCSSKRRRHKFEDKADISDSNHMDSPRSRKLQFPFAMADRVMIVGNKRTPQRFVGREAIVMSQCLNGWYVVKTLDSDESVKLQYRSLTKVP